MLLLDVIAFVMVQLMLLLCNYFVNSLKDFLPKEYCKVKGIEKKIFQVSFAYVIELVV